MHRLLNPLIRAIYRFFRIFYRFRRLNFYCEQLWLRTSILQDGRLEPCNCAISQMEPKDPQPSILDTWKSGLFESTRKYLLDRMLNPGKIPDAKSAYDCCASCPVAPNQRFDRVFIRDIIRDCVAFKAKVAPIIVLRKLGNLMKLIREVNGRRSQITAYPMLANLDPANVCNLRCPECAVGTGEINQPQGMMEWETYEKTLNEIGPYLFYLELFRYGDPLLHKDILKIIEVAEKQYGIITLISSNFSMPLDEEFLRGLIKSGLSRLIVAIDDIEQDLYVKYRRGGDANRVIDQLKTLIRLKKEMNSDTPHIRWQTLIFNFNEDRKEEIEKFAWDLGVDDFGFMPAYLSPNNYDLKPKEKKTRGGKDNRKSQIVRAEIVSGKVSLEEPFRLEVEAIQNIFTEAIPPSPKDSGIRLGIKVADKDKKEMGDLGRILFEKEFNPGETMTFSKEFSFPHDLKVEDVAYLKLDFLLEGKFWFEQNMEIQSQPYFLEIEFKKETVGP